jgi:hypothetical protein
MMMDNIFISYNLNYLTLCKLSFERCLTQDVVSPHCGDKRMVRHCMGYSLPNYFVISLVCWEKHFNVSNVNKTTV